jgi:prepilin-type N-terminal cleavage/methylation domain-containing protein
MKTKDINKGFTLIEVLLVITLIGILLTIGLVNFNSEARFIDARNDIRKTHIRTLESAITQYRLQNGSYPAGLTRDYQEICDPDASSCTGFIDLKTSLVPNFLQAIPRDPNDTDNTGGAGYSVAVDEDSNIVSIRSLQAEDGVEIKVNDPLPNVETSATNIPLAATAPSPPPIVTNGLLLHLDAGNQASYPGTGNTWFDLSGNNRNFTLFNPSYYSYSSLNGGSIGFTRTLPPVGETGGYAEHNGSGVLAVANYLYNNHTTEIWARINDRNPTNYNSNETISALFVYRGWHCMFYYGATSLNYNIWNGTTNTQNWTPLSIGTSGTDIIQGQWFHAVAVRNGNNMSSYINGVLKGTNVINTSNGSGGVSNTIRMGMANPSNEGFSWHANANVAAARMYSRALTPEEIQQNFNATRGRFGL